MKGGRVNQPDEEKDPANLDGEELSTNEQGRALPMFAGESKFALVWICAPFSQYTKEAPNERPGKK